jgi:hypothetical protein
VGKEIREIVQSKGKPKERVALLCDAIRKDDSLMVQLIDLLQTGRDADRGTCADAVESLSRSNHELVAPFIDTLVAMVDYRAPRVKWGMAESIAHLARYYPDRLERAVPALWSNAKGTGTVVRWCAAYALTEIAKYNSKLQGGLLVKFNDVVQTEENNGVRNVYLKALKNIAGK